MDYANSNEYMYAVTSAFHLMNRKLQIKLNNKKQYGRRKSNIAPDIHNLVKYNFLLCACIQAVIINKTIPEK